MENEACSSAALRLSAFQIIRTEFGTTVNGRSMFSELLRDFSVVVLAVGSETPRDLQVKGRDLKGIHFALEYLPVQNKHNASEPF